MMQRMTSNPESQYLHMFDLIQTDGDDTVWSGRVSTGEILSFQVVGLESNTNTDLLCSPLHSLQHKLEYACQELWYLRDFAYIILRSGFWIKVWPLLEIHSEIFFSIWRWKILINYFDTPRWSEEKAGRQVLEVFK